MMRTGAALIRIAAAFTAALASISAGAQADLAGSGTLRVCADPNNLPFSNQAGEGFENKLAELVAAELGKEVTYTWWAQRQGFIRNTLKDGRCDVVMGVPAQYELTETTRPYYRSMYVFVSKADHHYELRSIKDARLKSLSIGVQLIGEHGYNTPPVHALSQQGIIDNLVGFTVYGDYRTPNPRVRIMQAVADGRVDIAAVWGPPAGYFARLSPVPLVVTPISDTEGFAPQRFAYDIAIGVRPGDHALRNEINNVLARRRPDVTSLLASYGVPLAPVATADSRKTD
jgi:mxaJ protein